MGEEKPLLPPPFLKKGKGANFNFNQSLLRYIIGNV